MRRELVDRLKRALPVLRRDLVFDDIAGQLVANEVIVQQDLQLIRENRSDVARCNALVDVLAGKEDRAFEEFVNVLRVEHYWLAEEVEEPSVREVADVTDSVPVINCRPVNRVETVGQYLDRVELEKKSPGITDEMIQLVRVNHRASRDWTRLAHALGLTGLVHKIRTKVLVYGDDLDECVVRLLEEWMGRKPKDANLKNLVKALRTEGFNDVADELVEKYTK